jgi:hypothetical protein
MVPKGLVFPVLFIPKLKPVEAGAEGSEVLLPWPNRGAGAEEPVNENPTDGLDSVGFRSLTGLSSIRIS